MVSLFQPQLLGLKLNDPYPTAPAIIASGAEVEEDYCFQFLSSIIGTMCEKYFPCYKLTGQNLRVELQLVDNVTKAFYTKGAITEVKISNFEFGASFIELSDTAINIIEQSLGGGELSYVVSAWRNYIGTATIAEHATSTLTTTVNTLIPAKFSSLKSILVVPRNKGDGGVTYDSFSSHSYGLSEYNFRFGGVVLPSKKPSTAPEHFMEMIKCIDCISNLNHEPLISPLTYSRYLYSQANTETMYAPNHTTPPGQFMFGIDCEVYANADKNELFSGFNSNSLDIYVTTTHIIPGAGLGGNTNVRFDSFALYDSVFVFSDGNCNVRI